MTSSEFPPSKSLWSLMKWSKYGCRALFFFNIESHQSGIKRMDEPSSSSSSCLLWHGGCPTLQLDALSSISFSHISRPGGSTGNALNLHPSVWFEWKDVYQAGFVGKMFIAHTSALNKTLIFITWNEFISCYLQMMTCYLYSAISFQVCADP